MNRDFVSYVSSLYAEQGAHCYGSEAVTQLEHALQCATLAEGEGASDLLIAASLMHDLGHLLHNLGENVAHRGVHDRHEYRPIRMLRRHFGEAVLAPIRLHVEAKRYLCAVHPGYFDRLSSASRLSLELQGGACTEKEAERFLAEPFAQDALRLRAWDDRAKVSNQQTPDLPYFMSVLSRCAR